MESRKESLSLMEDYLGIGQRTLGLLVAIAGSTLVATAGIYIAVYGLQRWRTNMDRAGAAMVIDFQTPTAAPAARYVCPNCSVTGVPVQGPGRAPLCPICGAEMRSR